jgi:hypothetical protein
MAQLGRISTLIVPFTFVMQFAAADTVTFNDLTETPTLTIVGNRIQDQGPGCSSLLTSERCSVLDFSPFTPPGTFGGTLPDFVLIYDGATTLTGLSDYISRVDVVNSVAVNFTSNGTNEQPLPPPGALGTNPDLTGCFGGTVTVNGNSVRCMAESGGVQTAGTITFTNAAGNVTTDTVMFSSDTEVPEPSETLPLFSLGGAALLASLRMKQGSQTR